MSDNSKRNNGIVNKILIAVILVMVIVMAIFVYVVLFSGIYYVTKNEKNVSIERIYHVCDDRDIEKYNKIEEEFYLPGSTSEDKTIEELNQVREKEKALSKEIKGRKDFDKDATCLYLVVKIGDSDSSQQETYVKKLNNLSEKGVNPNVNLDGDFKNYLSAFN